MVNIHLGKDKVLQCESTRSSPPKNRVKLNADAAARNLLWQLFLKMKRVKF